jgi:hypothetical protein
MSLARLLREVPLCVFMTMVFISLSRGHRSCARAGYLSSMRASVFVK